MGVCTVHTQYSQVVWCVMHCSVCVCVSVMSLFFICAVAQCLTSSIQVAVFTLLTVCDVSTNASDDKGNPVQYREHTVKERENNRNDNQKHNNA